MQDSATLGGLVPSFSIGQLVEARCGVGVDHVGLGGPPQEHVVPSEVLEGAGGIQAPLDGVEQVERDMPADELERGSRSRRDVE